MSRKKGGSLLKKKSFWKHKFFRKRNVFSICSFLFILLFIIFLCLINMFPVKYILFISIGLLLLDILSIIFINVHRKVILKIFGSFFMILLVVGSILGIYYLHSTNTFMKDSFVSKNVYSKNTYYVLALSDKNFTTNDIKEEVVAYQETAYLDDAYSKLKDKFSVREREVSDIKNVFDCLNSGINQFALIEKSSYEIAFSVDKSLNKSRYKVIYDFDVYTKKEEGVQNTDNRKFNVYIGGTDSFGLMDFNIIASVNMDTHEVLLTSIPRDYYIEVVGKNGRFDKLSFMNAYGADTCKKSLENYFGIDIAYTLTVDTTSLVKAVDYLDGIEFCSDYEYTTSYVLNADTNHGYNKELTVEKGCQHLDGAETLAVMRERVAFSEDNLARQDNCSKILLAIIEKIVSTDTILHYNETLNTLGNLYETDIPKEVITEASKNILNTGDFWTIKTQAVAGVGGYNKVHLSNMMDWVMYPNQDSVLKATTAIQEILS